MPNGEEWRHYPLEDGLLINQENSHNTWILETFLPSSERAIFDELLKSGEVFNARAVISFPDNNPVTFRLIVNVIKDIEDYVSVLMKGTLIRKKRKNPTEVLHAMLQQSGADGDVEALLEQFELELREK